MDIGIPKQRRPFDYRVGLTPMGVEILTGHGHRCYVESGAGHGSGFEDERYCQAGAQIVYTTEEVYGRGQMILSVSRPTILGKIQDRQGRYIRRAVGKASEGRAHAKRSDLVNLC